MVGLVTSMPMAHAGTDDLTLDGISGPFQSRSCQISTPTLACATAIGVNTTRANDVVILALYSNGMSVSQIIDKSGLNFVARFEMAGDRIAEYYAIASSVIADDNTTVVFSGTRHALTFAVSFAVSGANTNRVFDPSSTLPTDTICPVPPILPACSLNVPTKRGDELLFALTDIGDSSNCVTGFTNVFSNGRLEIDYSLPGARGTTTFSCGRVNGSDPVAIVGDAIFPHPST